MRFITSGIIAVCILLLPVSGRAAGTDLHDFGEMPAVLEEALLKSIFDNELFLQHSARAEQIPDPRLKGFWRGNRPVVAARIFSLRLGFTGAPGGDSGQTAQAGTMDGDGSLQVEVEFDQQKVIVRSVSQRSRKYPGGIRLTLNKNRSWGHLLEISRRLSVAVALAREADLNLRGILICPVVSLPPRSGAVPSADGFSEYLWSTASFRGEATAHGRFNSGLEPGVGYASILRSSTMSPAGGLDDHTFSREVLVGTDYLPQGDALITDAAGMAGLGAGLIAQIDLQNAAGYRKISRAESVVWLKRLRPARRFMAGTGSGQTEITPAECVAVVSRSDAGEAYSKEELRVPPEFVTPAAEEAKEEVEQE